MATSTSATNRNPKPNVRRQNAPAGALPGAGFSDPYLDSLVQAADLIATCPDGDPYASDIKPACMVAHNALQTVRTLAWQANDLLLRNLGASQGLVQANIEAAKRAVPTSGFGAPIDRDAAVHSAGITVGRDSAIAVANGVLAERSGPGDDAALAFATSLQDASAIVDLASHEWTGPPILRRNFTADDCARVDALEVEIGREGAGLPWASQYLSAAIGKRPDRDLFVFCAAALRAIETVRQEPAPKRNVRLPSQGGGRAAAELDASYALANQIDDWLVAHKPPSITMGARVLVILESVGAELCGSGNIGGLTVGQFANAFLDPQRGKAIAGFQARSGWLASWLPPKGQSLPGFSPQAGRASMGLPFRFGRGET